MEFILKIKNKIYRLYKIIVKKAKKCIEKHFERLLFEKFSFNKCVAVSVNKKNVYKITWNGTAKLFDKELKLTNNSKFQSNIWFDFAITYRPVFKINNRFLRIIAGKSKKIDHSADQSQVDSFVWELLTLNLNQFDSIIWYESLDQLMFKNLIEYLPETKVNFIKSFLSEIYLPKTGSHGDLIDQNILYDYNSGVKIIDWEYFRPNGSLYTDILRLYSRRNEKDIAGQNYSKYNKQFDPFCLPKHNFLELLQSKLKVSHNQLSLLSAITNTTLPVVSKKEIRFESLEYYLDIFANDINSTK